MKNTAKWTAGWAAILAMVWAAAAAFAGDAPRMSIDELRSRLGEPGLTVVDTRAAGDWGSSAQQVRGAVRRDPNAVAAWAEEFDRSRPIVAYCA